jgi:hypothetical protein|tara:strand:+ start:7456 stop:7896 length:441 start_codon:yes stop_codon:yes gene_type:complete
MAAADLKTIQLQDGSSLKGEVISLQNGVYTIRTLSLGLITLDAARVISINPGHTGSGGTGASVITGTPAVGAAELDAVKQLMVSNGDIMATILELHNDPQLQKVLSDPEIMRAVQNLDIEALANNRKFTQLLNNPKIKQIQRQVHP